MSAAAQRARYTDRERRLRIVLHRGGLKRRGVHRAASLLRRSARVLPAGQHSGVRSRARQRAKRKSIGLLRASGSCRSRRASVSRHRVLSGSGASSARGSRTSAVCTFARRRAPAITARIDRHAGCRRLLYQRSVTGAPPCGLFGRHRTLGAFGLARGSFERPYNHQMEPARPTFVRAGVSP